MTSNQEFLYFIKSSLPGHKITEKIEKKQNSFKTKIKKTGMEYDIEIISKLPTAELKICTKRTLPALYNRRL